MMDRMCKDGIEWNCILYKDKTMYTKGFAASLTAYFDRVALQSHDDNDPGRYVTLDIKPQHENRKFLCASYQVASAENSLKRLAARAVPRHCDPWRHTFQSARPRDPENRKLTRVALRGRVKVGSAVGSRKGVDASWSCTLRSSLWNERRGYYTPS